MRTKAKQEDQTLRNKKAEQNSSDQGSKNNEACEKLKNESAKLKTQSVAEFWSIKVPKI